MRLIWPFHHCRPATVVADGAPQRVRLLDDRRGAVAMEFAIVSIPFFLLLFAIFEMALMFFIGQVLDTATMSASRLIRTGEAKAQSLTQDQFKAKICAGMVSLVNCDARLYVDVQSYSSFGSYTPTSPLDKDGNISSTKYTSGNKSEIIVVRSFYAWPVMFDLLARSTTRLASGDQLLGAVVAFQTEPFPW
ncbi:TadZ/CpaE, associated with Flp pilus assembly [uncultured Pleomorphomonas sp.]|uniref:TadZ/CpaE, associated with Flp pilus assembly n=1 Tax=uncultured Pleomorphomonas sp. TaxID=442121 RepID=A0A212LKZ4_9HYPH|nr:TadE/TadG family type IV pilus assembly protein [uncultured Pleomorphomonas sp.]SCM78205.1 TadZ/CpaE, associated with Flp pilus assembly [uncultured Pleomorphomonas sp.]